MPLDSSRAPTSASPLWIIALFIALSEATAGVAAATTDGAARLIFACFAATFPVIVLFVFVWLLVKHAPKLYADAVDESSIVVNLDILKPGAKNLHIPVSLETGIQSMLNEIYFALSSAVEPATYDRSWVLTDDDNNEYSGMGMSWAAEQKLDEDPRTLLEVGILPGSHLTAVPKKRGQRRRPTDHSPDLAPT